MGFYLVLIYGKIALNHLSTKGLPEPCWKDPLAGPSLSFSVSDCPRNADTLGRGLFSMRMRLGVPLFISAGGEQGAGTVRCTGLGGLTAVHLCL